ncbi:hypothetical protein IF2G_09641 [Cordyceps javanica]|nr:hypothetical protein IF2G_09641 [Cordyceps javanica]
MGGRIRTRRATASLVCYIRPWLMLASPCCKWSLLLTQLRIHVYCIRSTVYRLVKRSQSARAGNGDKALPGTSTSKRSPAIARRPSLGPCLRAKDQTARCSSDRYQVRRRDARLVDKILSASPNGAVYTETLAGRLASWLASRRLPDFWSWARVILVLGCPLIRLVEDGQIQG